MRASPLGDTTNPRTLKAAIWQAPGPSPPLSATAFRNIPCPHGIRMSFSMGWSCRPTSTDPTDPRVVDSAPRPCKHDSLGDRLMLMDRHDHSQRSGRSAVTRPVHPLPPLFRTEKQLTAPADRPVPDAAHAVAFTTAVVIRGAGSVHLRTGMRTARALPGDSGRAGSPPATDSRHDPSPPLPAIRTRCFADHHPACRWPARPDGSPAVGGGVMGPNGTHPDQAKFLFSVNCPNLQKREVQNDTQRTARARGVSPGEPGVSHAARVHQLTLTGRLRCGRESSQGAASRFAILSEINIWRNV